jgi:hypothetical protein
VFCGVDNVCGIFFTFKILSVPQNNVMALNNGMPSDSYICICIREWTVASIRDAKADVGNSIMSDSFYKD